MRFTTCVRNGFTRKKATSSSATKVFDSLPVRVSTSNLDPIALASSPVNVVDSNFAVDGMFTSQQLPNSPASCLAGMYAGGERRLTVHPTMGSSKADWQHQVTQICLGTNNPAPNLIFLRPYLTHTPNQWNNRKKDFQLPSVASIPYPPINVDYLETEFNGHGVSFTSISDTCVIKMKLDNGSLVSLMLPSGLITSYKAPMWHAIHSGIRGRGWGWFHSRRGVFGLEMRK